MRSTVRKYSGALKLSMSFVYREALILYVSELESVILDGLAFYDCPPPPPPPHTHTHTYTRHNGTCSLGRPG